MKMGVMKGNGRNFTRGWKLRKWVKQVTNRHSRHRVRELVREQFTRAQDQEALHEDCLPTRKTTFGWCW